MKADYQKAFNLAEDLKKDSARPGVVFNDAIFRKDFSSWLYDYLDGKLSKEKFKELLQGRLLLADLLIPKDRNQDLDRRLDKNSVRE